jgi:alanine racemase
MDVPASFTKQHLPLNTIHISKKALVDNYTYLHNLNSDLKVAPVLKSNAYGHDIGLIGKILDDVGAPFFCVQTIEEGFALVKQNVTTPILIMGYVDPRNLRGKKLPFSYAVSTLETLETILQYQPHAPIHLFVDTGMRREGFPMTSMSQLIRFIKTKKDIHIEGLMAHFAASENNALTKMQLKNFLTAQTLFKDAGISFKWVHHANSSGLLNYKNYKGKIGNVARTGIAVFGIDPEMKDTALQPILEFTSTLTQIKDLVKGESSGYGFTFTAKKKMRIGVVAAGYYDGVDKRLSNVGYMKMGKTFCKIIGWISMNLTVIDLTAVRNPRVGDKVIIFSNNPKDKNAIASSAVICKTISYELLVGLASAIKRIVV